MIGSLISNNMHDVLINNDQLKYNMSQKLVLQNFIEPPLNFKPTYKYDIGTNLSLLSYIHIIIFYIH